MTPSTHPSTPERPLSATRLAQYVTVRGRCERYLRLSLFPSEGQALMQRYGVTPEALSPLLAEAGSVFEHAAVAQLAAQASMTDLRHQSAQASIDLIRGQPVGRALYYQVTLTGQLGAVACEGIAAVIDVVRRADQVLDITVIDIKASRRTSVSFCLQIAVYARSSPMPWHVRRSLSPPCAGRFSPMERPGRPHGPGRVRAVRCARHADQP